MGVADRSTTWSGVLGTLRSETGPDVYEETIPRSLVGPVPPQFDTQTIGAGLRLHTHSPAPGTYSILIIETDEFYLAGRRRALTAVTSIGMLLYGLAASAVDAGDA